MVPASMDEPCLADLGLDPVEVEVDVDAVGHGLRVGVLGDQVLPEEAEGLLAGGGGQADDVGVEVVQHALPDAVDGAVGLIDDDQVERLRREGLVVGHGDRGVGDEVVQVRVVLVGDLVPGQCAEHPLDRGDDDLGAAQHPGTGELVHVVDLGEPATIIGGAVVLELRQRLVGQVVAVDQEQDPVEPAMLQQPVCRGHRREGLARPGGHLHQGPVETLLGQGSFDAADRGDLGRAQHLDVQLRHRRDLAAPGRAFRVGGGVTQGPGQGGGLREGEDPSGSGVGVVAVGEVGLRAAGLEHERQAAIRGHGLEADLGGQPLGIHRALPLHPRQGRALPAWPR